VSGFLALELERRRELGYPPFRHLVSLLVSGPEPGAPDRLLHELRQRLEREPDDVLGPAALLRLRGRHRSQLVIKTSEPRRVARAAASLLEAATPALRRNGLTAVVDVDPQSF
jgi:primosomal protein N' (replication factor Y)